MKHTTYYRMRRRQRRQHRFFCYFCDEPVPVLVDDTWCPKHRIWALNPKGRR